MIYQKQNHIDKSLLYENIISTQFQIRIEFWESTYFQRKNAWGEDENWESNIH